jgi:hypothetical protein
MIVVGPAMLLDAVHSANMPNPSLFQAGATLVPLSSRMLSDVGGQRFLGLGNPDDPLPTASSRTESGGTGATLPARTAGAAQDMET